MNDRDRHISLLANCSIDISEDFGSKEFYKLWTAVCIQITRERIAGKGLYHRVKALYHTWHMCQYIFGLLEEVKWDPKGNIHPKVALVTIMREYLRSKGI